jgi:hypothetical protein
VAFWGSQWKFTLRERKPTSCFLVVGLFRRTSGTLTDVEEGGLLYVVKILLSVGLSTMTGAFHGSWG